MRVTPADSRSQKDAARLSGDVPIKEYSSKMRVLLADDQAWLRSAVRLVLEQEPDIEVVGEAAEVYVLLSTAEAMRPDLVLLDWELPGVSTDSGSVRLLGILRHCCPHVTVIVLSGRPEAGALALDAGADYFVSKADPPDSLLSAVRNVRRAQSSPLLRQ
jgi:DNA-binding NarL/FixJ family response regulator